MTNTKIKKHAHEGYLQTLCSWRSMLGPLLTIPKLLIVLTALFSPLDVLDRYPSLAAIAGQTRNFLLDINMFADIARYADSTAYPQVALLVCALCWLWLPFSVALLVVLSEIWIAQTNWSIWKKTLPFSGMKLLRHATNTMIVVVILAVCAASATMIPGDWSLADGITTNNRLGLGLITSGIFFFLAQSISGLYLAFRASIDLHIRGK